MGFEALVPKEFDIPTSILTSSIPELIHSSIGNWSLFVFHPIVKPVSDLEDLPMSGNPSEITY